MLAKEEEEPVEIPFASVTDEVLNRLSECLAYRIEPRLSHTTFDSRILWPEKWVGLPFLKFEPIPFLRVAVKLSLPDGGE
jgi:hypothetical protein